jgi:spermidine synthase
MLQIIVFLCGAVLMSLEMVGSRLLAPYFGSSIYVWGSLIVVVMAALTLGYYCGGRIADKHPSYMVLAAFTGLAGIFIGFLPFWNHPVNSLCSMLEPRTGSLLASFAFFFIPSVLLATISPFGIKLTGHSLSTIGNTAGFMSAISTAGSIIGTLVTSFFLIPAMGVKNIVHFLGLILLLISLLALVLAWKRPGDNPRPDPKRLNNMIFLAFLSIMILLFMWIAVPFRTVLHYDSKTLYDRDSLYHHITVDQIGTERHLHFDNSYQSAIDLDLPLQMVFSYTSYLHLGVVARPYPSRALFIGLGGGSAPKKFLHDYHSLQTIDIVEIDPETVNAAYRYFQLPDNPRFRVIVQDGRLYVEKMARDIAAGKEKPYDIIVIDAYSSSTIPYHLTTREFVQRVRDITSSGGVVVSNIIGAIDGPNNKLLFSMKHTIDTVFPQSYLFPVGGWKGPGDTSEANVILVATMSSKYWDSTIWLKNAKHLQDTGVITENVSEYAQFLVEKSMIREPNRHAHIPLLTDDYAPVDTLKNPLLNN